MWQVKICSWKYQQNNEPLGSRCCSALVPNPDQGEPPTLHISDVSLIKHTWFNSKTSIVCQIRETSKTCSVRGSPGPGLGTTAVVFHANITSYIGFPSNEILKNNQCLCKTAGVLWLFTRVLIISLDNLISFSVNRKETVCVFTWALCLCHTLHVSVCVRFAVACLGNCWLNRKQLVRHTRTHAHAHAHAHAHTHAHTHTRTLSHSHTHIFRRCVICVCDEQNSSLYSDALIWSDMMWVCIVCCGARAHTGLYKCHDWLFLHTHTHILSFCHYTTIHTQTPYNLLVDQQIWHVSCAFHY